MKIDEFVKIDDEGDTIRIRGQLVLGDMGTIPKENSVIGTAMKDIKKEERLEIDLK